MTMKIINKIIIRYILYTFPIVFILLVWGSFLDLDNLKFSSRILKNLWDILGLNFMVWIGALIYIMVSLIFSKELRNSLLTRLAGIKERDERESLIAGAACKFTFLTTISILIFFIFLSTIQISIFRKNADQVPPGEKRGAIHIGFMFEAVEKNTKAKRSGVEKMFFDYDGMPITKSGILIILLVWQVLSYHYFARRTLRYHQSKKTLCS